MRDSVAAPSPVSVRLPSSLDRWVRQQASMEHRTVADMVRVLTHEARVTRLFPPIVYRDGPTGRRAAFLDGPDIWEVLEPYLLNDQDEDILRESWPHLPAWKLEMAQRFHELFPEEIEARVARNNAE
jgi:hypothetical protein